MTTRPNRALEPTRLTVRVMMALRRAAQRETLDVSTNTDVD
jgi:hypothetical protein